MCSARLSVSGQDVRFEEQEGGQAAKVHTAGRKAGQNRWSPPVKRGPVEEARKRKEVEGAERTGDAVQARASAENRKRSVRSFVYELYCIDYYSRRC